MPSRFIDVEQNTDAWLALRLGKATASKFPVIMAHDGKAFGEPAKEYALQLALEILNGRSAGHSFSNAHMERGHQQEPIARALYEREYFCTVTNGGFFDCGEYGDSPDGLVGSDIVLEIKSVTAPVHYANLRRGSFDPAYRWQLVGHIDCTERPIAHFASFCSDFPEESRLAVFPLHRDECKAELERLRARRAEFLKMVRQTMNTIDPSRCWPGLEAIAA
jgi:hypothetical protein